MTGSCEDLHGSLKLAISNYFGSDLYLGLYAGNYEPFFVKYWEVGHFGDSRLVRLQQVTRH